MAKAKIALYIGSDPSYWEVIQKRIQQHYGAVGFVFKQDQIKSDRRYTDIFLDCVKEPPALIYVDFSTQLKEQIQLARMIGRENSIADVPLIGLVDKKSEVRGCLAAGADVVHVKCGEYHDVVYDAIFLMDQKLVKPPAFAKGKMAHEDVIYDDFRIGYITEKGIHAEGNLNLEEGQEIEVQNAIPTSIVPSKRYRVSKVDQTNLYYDFRYCYDLDFLFVDPPEAEFSELEMMITASQDEEEKKRLQKKLLSERSFKEREAQTLLEHARKKTKDWVKKNTIDSAPKTTKVLIVDRSLGVLTQIDRALDAYPFAIRMQTYLKDQVPEIRKVRPSIIAFQYLTVDLVGLDPEKAEALADRIQEEREHSENQLTAIFEYLKSGDGSYHPLVLVYNCPDRDAKELQDHFQYPLIIVKSGLMSMESLVQIGETFEKNETDRRNKKIQAKIQALKAKDPMKYRSLTPAIFEEARYYVSKSQDISYVSTTFDISIVSLTESEIELTCDERLELKTYRLEFPIEMSVRLVAQGDGKPCKDIEGGKKLYRGLIHSVGEEDKKEIRRQINEVFFSPLKEKREQEEAAFRELNEKKLQEKIAATAPSSGKSSDSSDEE